LAMLAASLASLSVEANRGALIMMYVVLGVVVLISLESTRRRIRFSRSRS
jgi:hypothetical protein